MKITKEMTIGDVVRKHPETVSALMGFGMGCIGCPSAQAESLEDAARVHGIEVDRLVQALNNSIQ
jgi:hybrid cluster-associated redox disulfide protein